MKAILILATAGLLAACGKPSVIEDRSDLYLKQAQVRKEAFAACMRMASNMPRQSDDDVADIVKACETHANNSTWYIQK